MKKIATLLIVGLMSTATAFADPNIWDNIDPIQLDATFHGKPITLSFITDAHDLDQADWDKFENTFINFWATQWKDMDPSTLGIKGDVKEFLQKHFMKSFDALKERNDACFLCFSIKEDDKNKPLFGVFSQRQLFAWEEENQLKSEEVFFLRLLVQTENEVLGHLATFTKGLFKHLPPLIKERGCHQFLSLARKTSLTKFSLKKLGFVDVPQKDIPADHNKWLLEHYPPEIYQLYLKAFGEEDN